MPSSQPRPGVPGIQQSADELAQSRTRARKAVDLAIAGHSYDEIAKKLGYADKSGAWRAIRGVLERQEAQTAKDYRDLENARLDRLQKRLWPMAMGRDDDRALRASDRLLRLFERRARLNGLDQQAAKDAGALAEALLGDPDARRQRLVELRDDLAEKRAAKEAG